MNKIKNQPKTDPDNAVLILSTADQTKLGMWRKRLKELEEVELPKASLRLADAAPVGDWHENAEYEDAERQVEILRARINDIKEMILKIRRGDNK